MRKRAVLSGMRRIILWTAPGLVVTLLSCKSSETQQKPVQLSPEEQAKADELRAEIDVGRNMTGRLLAAYGIFNNSKLRDYVSLVGQYVAQNSAYQDRSFMFEITEDTEVSAYSSPGGYILISVGALQAAENEAEIAGVLGHEISHIGKRHIWTTLKKKSAEKKESDKNADPDLSARKRDTASGDSKASTSVARYLSGPSGASLSVLMAATNALSMLLEKGLDHEMEYEADSEGLEFMTKAGYDGEAYLGYLRRLNSLDTKTQVMQKTHPSMQTRIEKLIPKLEAIKASPQGSVLARAIGKERYQKYVVLAKTPNKDKAK